MRYRLGLAGKYFIILTPVVMLLFLLLTWLNFRETQDILRRQILNESALVVEKTNQYLDLYYESIGNLLLYLGNEPDFTSERLREYVEDTPLVAETIYFKNHAGEVISSHPAMLEVFGSRLAFTRPDYPDASPAITWSGPYFSPISGKTVSFSQMISRGTVMVETDLDILGSKVIELIRREGQTVVITAPSGDTILFDEFDPLFPIIERLYPLEIVEPFRVDLIGGAKEAGEISWGDELRYVVGSNDNRLTWNISVLVDPQVFAAELRTLYVNFIQVGGTLFVLLLIASVVVSLIFSRPIRKLALAMDNVKSLSTLEPLPHRYADELGDLIESYNAMMDRINRLTYEKNNFEWRMLQSQIGPHFLYNTLACVNALAKRNLSYEIRETVNSLIELLRYTIDRSSEEVPLSDEIAVLNAYMTIQNIRYGDQFTLLTSVPEELQGCFVPALLLQPLVENAIFHGLAPRGQRGTVTVGALVKDDDLIITVADDGIGIEPRRLIEINKNITTGSIGSETKERLHSKDRLNAIGLENIRERLRVHYGPDYGIEVQSPGNDGTTIRINLPFAVSEKTKIGTF